MTRITNDSARVERINQNTHGDLIVVNSARVSFAKESKLQEDDSLSEDDKKLIRYLASHNHWTPFAHIREIVAIGADDLRELLIHTDPVYLAGAVWTKEEGDIAYLSHSLWGWFNLFLNHGTCINPNVWNHVFTKLRHRAPYSTQFLIEMYSIDEIEFKTVPVFDWPERHRYFTLRETVPIYTARQRFKHMVEFNYNEVSRRYVDEAPEIFVPTEFRGRATNKKQGSSDEIIEKIHDTDTTHLVGMTASFADDWYGALLKEGVCPEQARGILPLSTMTSYYVTGTTSAWKRLLGLRLDPHSQKEIQDLARLIDQTIGLELNYDRV